MAIRIMKKTDGKHPGLFELRTARQLFEKAKKDAELFWTQPTDENLFNYLCTLNHLRDWICPGGWDSYKDTPRGNRTAAERIHAELFEDPDFSIVRDLCNNAKHFYDHGVGSRTGIVEGARCGLARCGDRFSQRYLLVDHKDIRVIAGNVLNRYRAFFDDQDE